MTPPNPGRFTNRIKELRAEKRAIAYWIERRTLTGKGIPQKVYDDQKRVSEELLVVQDDYHDYTGISRREAKMSEADLDRAMNEQQDYVAEVLRLREGGEEEE